MTIAVSYPGVYINEIPSGVRTIVGVSTSIAAFVGRAVKGPVNDPVSVFGFADFERVYGGLHVDYPLSYALYDFFLNGGQHAIIVRLYNGNSEGTACLVFAGLTIEASSPGKWGNSLQGRLFVTPDDSNDKESIAHRLGVEKKDLFNLRITDADSKRTEEHRNLTMKESARRVDRVLNTESRLCRIGKNETLPRDACPIPSEPGKDLTADGGIDSKELVDADYMGQDAKSGINALENCDLFNILCIPPDTRDSDVPATVHTHAVTYCMKRRAIFLVDAPRNWRAAHIDERSIQALGLAVDEARNAAIFFPRVQRADPLRNGQIDTFVPCGMLAGIMARTDVTRGVWKAAAGIAASLNGSVGLAEKLTDEDNGRLNPLGINCLRSFPVIGNVAWGARTLRGADQLADEWKYLPVRRLALYIEESLYRGTQWIVFEPNDEPLWAQIRLNITSFMQNLFRQGAFQGATPREAYFVKCDKETTTQDDINRGIVNIVVGFSPLKPAEFVIINLQQMAGQLRA